MPWWKSVPKTIWGHAKKIRISPKNYKYEKKDSKTQGLNHQTHAFQPKVLTITSQKLMINIDIYINISTFTSVLPASSSVCRRPVPSRPDPTRLQNFIMKIAPDHSTTLSSAAPSEGLDSTRAAGTF